MKTIGLIGGMSWESTLVYYQHLNRMAHERLGGFHSAKLILWSFDFAEIEAFQSAGDWKTAADAMIVAAQNIERGGAECIVIYSNTMHKMAFDVQGAVDIPLIHIADTTARAIKAKGTGKPLLVATRYTMEQDFYKVHLRDKHGIDVCIPDDADRDAVHAIVYDELCQGIVSQESKQRYLNIIEKATTGGADGVIFGYTEVGLLLNQSDLKVPVFDTTELHAKAALDFSLRA